jgi:hypothetical protein
MFSADDIVVCSQPSSGPGYRDVTVSFAFTDHPEGDTRGCGGGNDCSWLQPTSTRHQTVLRFVQSGPSWLLALPQRIAEDDAEWQATPLDQPHDTGCYGTKPAFTPQPIPWGPWRRFRAAC